MRKYILLLVLLGLCLGHLSAQDLSWRKHRKLGNEYYEKGNYDLAAENYEKAWQKKKSKEELIFKAAESYYLIKDFRKAAECYQYVKNDNEDYPLVGLKYARSLKQDGQYEKAKQQFQTFWSTYTGEGKTILEDIIKNEIAGCELAKELPARARRDVEIRYPEGNINTEADEFSPTPAENNELFFTSTRGNRARIYSSFRQAELWTRASVPSNFPVIREGHYGNGAMSPNGNRFYFTICNDDKAFNDLTSRCELFVIRRNGSAWSSPERLPEYINIEKVTNTHPAVAHLDGREYVFFSSNREPTRGGMDLFYVSRDMTQDDLEFTFPANLGGTINTLGDEITPYYDAEERKLYFASNGHITIGGFDLFTATGNEQNWSTPENMGLPFNSGADDFGYSQNQAHTGGFLVSNRIFGGEKTSTRHTDIFEYTIEGRALTVQGNVYDRESGSSVDNIEVNLYEIDEDGGRNLIKTRNFTSGSYAFEVEADKAYEVEVIGNGFLNGAFQFTTTDTDTPTYGQPIFLLKEPAIETEDPSMTIEEQPVNTEELPMETPPVQPEPEEEIMLVEDDPPVNIPPPSSETIDESMNDAPEETTRPVHTSYEPEETEYVARAKSADDNYEYTSVSPRHEGIYYKIQLAAVRNYDPQHEKFLAVQSIGRLDTEKIIERDLTRVLLAEFFSKQEAYEALQVAQNNGFDSAYIVKYEDGTRFGKVQ